METIKEIIKMNAADWMWIILVIIAVFAVSRFFGLTIVWDPEKRRVVFSPSVANKIDRLLKMTMDMWLDIMALQIMNEHLLATERYKIWCEYERLGGNGFVKTYVDHYVIPAMREEMTTNESK
jgi:hypothetical protein